MGIVIEKNIEQPETWKEQLDKLAEGDSFSFPRERRSSVAAIVARDYHANTEKRFKISIKGQPKKKARVWRIEDEVIPTVQA